MNKLKNKILKHHILDNDIIEEAKANNAFLEDFGGSNSSPTLKDRKEELDKMYKFGNEKKKMEAKMAA